MPASIRDQRLLDALAIGASTACLVHCLILPALLVLLPALAAFLAVPEEFHLWALLFAIPTSAAALLAGYRRHRQIGPALPAALGLALLAAGVLAGSSATMETAF
jgi:hypothetical protein